MQVPLAVIVLFLILEAICKCQARSPKLCNIAYDCSNEESPVWASTDGLFCEVFRNECLMLSENCDRVNQNRPKAKKISKRQCQEFCRSMVCLTVHNPVCGIYNGKRITFGNGCEMSRHICTTGQTFSLHKRRACYKTLIE